MAYLSQEGFLSRRITDLVKNLEHELHSDIRSGGTGHQERRPVTSPAQETLIVIPRSFCFDGLQMV
jgi:hypothetical protein